MPNPASNNPYPRRIVCLTEEPTEVLYRLGEGDRIVGISQFTVRHTEAPSGTGSIPAQITP